MKIFNRLFGRKKKTPEQLIREFETGRSILMNKVKEIASELRSRGYDVLELIPLLVSVGQAEKSPFGIMMVVTSELYQKFNEFADRGKYGNNYLRMFHVGDYTFMLIVARDDERKLAICYPSAFRRKHVKKIQGKDTLYLYIIDGQTSKYTLIYFPNVKWGEVPKEDIGGETGKSRPPPTMYR
ncbi:hypothetical protein DRN86_04485 [Candidatus Geothermarchaeota archaeon]|nr:MAG: hypothetical protein DRN86_04485 [Candidatus Geothermarchaeota archaeon]